MKTYMWETTIGTFVARAMSVDAAKRSVMALLREDDYAREELAEALSSNPKMIIGAFAIASWEP